MLTVKLPSQGRWEGVRKARKWRRGGELCESMSERRDRNREKRAGLDSGRTHTHPPAQPTVWSRHACGSMLENALQCVCVEWNTTPEPGRCFSDAGISLFSPEQDACWLCFSNHRELSGTLTGNTGGSSKGKEILICFFRIYWQLWELKHRARVVMGFKVICFRLLVQSYWKESTGEHWIFWE